MGVIGGKWKPIILYCLMGDKLRFGKLALLIPTISRKVLTEQLKELVNHGLVKREEFDELPPKVEYGLTELGKSLTPVINAMCIWGKKKDERLQTN